MTIANVQAARPVDRRFLTAAAGMARSTALAVALGSGLPVVAAEFDIERREGVPADASPFHGGIGGVSLRGGVTATAALPTAALPEKSPGSELPIKEHAPPDMTPRLFAQFQLPSAEGGQPSTEKLQKFLPYQYFIGVDPEMVFRRNDDLDSRTRDKSVTWLPSMSGIFTYRPFAWLETTTELQYEKEFAVHEEEQFKTPRHASFLIDQFNFTFKEFTAPFEISVGRKGFEDERRSLLDGSMDGVSALLRQGRFTGLGFIGRSARWSWDAAKRSVQPRDRINTFYGYGDYRASESVKFAGYGVVRDDRDKLEGTPITLGARAFGTPTAEVNYWAEAAYQGGDDELAKPISAYAYDFGVTRRFFDVPLKPNFTLGWAMGSGDGNPDDRVNRTFKPTNLGSNERRFAGIRQFRVFGETLDPDLSNIKIFTAGLGFRPDPQVSVDIVWHAYRLHRTHVPIQTALTVEPGQVDSALSKDLGTEWDLVINFNNFLGVRRLLFDVRVGRFRPGKAYIKNDGTNQAPILRNPDNALAGVLILQW